MSLSAVLDHIVSVYLLRVDRTPREGEMLPKQWITLFDLSRAIVAASGSRVCRM